MNPFIITQRVFVFSSISFLSLASLTNFETFLPVTFINTSSRVVWDIPQSFTKLLNSYKWGLILLSGPSYDCAIFSIAINLNSGLISVMLSIGIEKTIEPPLSSINLFEGAIKLIKSIIFYS